MDFETGGPSNSERQRRTAADIARKKVLAAYSSTLENLKNISPTPTDTSMHRPTPTYRSPYLANSPYARHTSSYLSSPTSTPSSIASASPSPYTTTAYSPQPSSTSTTSLSTPTSYSYPTTPPPTSTQSSNPTFKDVAINQTATSNEWKKYHSAWQDYYKNYYSDYYAKAAQTYLATEKLKNERVASGQTRRARRARHLTPIFIVIFITIIGLFLQYNRLIFAPLMAYIVPEADNSSTSIAAVDPTITQNVSAEPRLLIPKLNIDVPVAFNIPTEDVENAMNYGVAQFSIPGANALPGQVGNLAISGHSAGDIYSSNPYKFIFSGLERLETGDLVYINYDSTRYTYQVTGHQTVDPSDVAALVYQTNKPMLTLITCTPLGTSRYRLLVSAEQISPAYDTAEVANEPSHEPSSDHQPDSEMPANSPSFFENIWRSLFGGTDN